MKTLINFALTPIMAWCEGALKKCESPEDESHHSQRKGHETLKVGLENGEKERKGHKALKVGLENKE